MTASAKRRPRAQPSLAARANRHELYERAVQDPDSDTVFFARIFERYRGRVPLILREDFCGTAVLCATWVASRPDRRAIGIDLDQDTLDWGKRHHLEPLAADVARRVELVQADVMDGVGPRADVVCALNFSYCVFKERATLLRYFRAARERLVADGLFVIDIYGGPDSMSVEQTENDMGEFLYVWDQATFCALTHQTVCHIHFHFPDGSRMRRAFTYDWRLWTVPELRDLMLEAGFSRVHLLWERTDADGGETGSFYEPKSAENMASWWTYLVAER